MSSSDFNDVEKIAVLNKVVGDLERDFILLKENFDESNLQLENLSNLINKNTKIQNELQPEINNIKGQFDKITSNINIINTKIQKYKLALRNPHGQKLIKMINKFQKYIDKCGIIAGNMGDCSAQLKTATHTINNISKAILNNNNKGYVDSATQYIKDIAPSVKKAVDAIASAIKAVQVAKTIISVLV